MRGDETIEFAYEPNTEVAEVYSQLPFFGLSDLEIVETVGARREERGMFDDTVETWYDEYEVEEYWLEDPHQEYSDSLVDEVEAWYDRWEAEFDYLPEDPSWEDEEVEQPGETLPSGNSRSRG